MPTILRYKGFKFFFYSNEGCPRETAHIHVRGNNSEAKFWLIPDVILARNDGFNARELRELACLVEQHQQEFEEKWHEYFA